MPTTTGKATDFITFSRASLATVTDADGKIKWAGHNLLPASEQFDSSLWTKVGANVSANNIAAPNGTTTAEKLVEQAVSGEHNTRQSVTGLQANVAYTVSVFMKAGERTRARIINYNAGADYYGIIVDLSNGTFVADASGGTFSDASYSITAVGSGWYLISLTATMAGTTRQPYFNIVQSGTTFSYTGDGTSGIYLWGAHLYRSDLGGMVANTSAYPMYNPTTPKNLLGFTEDFSNAAWVKTNASVTANAITATNGLQGADAIYDSSATGVHYIRQDSIAVTSGTSYVFSVYAKANGRGFIALLDPGASGGSKGRYFSIPSDGSGSALGILDGTPTASSITHLGDGWYRCSITVSAGGSTMSPRIYISDTGSNISYAGDITKGVFLWGAQLSDSASLDAYSPVYGAAVTSAAYYAPRLDFDPVTLAARGLLVEEQRTNLLLHSAAFDNAAWEKSGTSAITANQTAAPDGVSTADLFRCGATAASELRQTNKTVASGTSTFSVYFKKEASDWAIIQVFDATTTSAQRVWFNLNTGVKGSSASLGSNISLVGYDLELASNGFFRCRIVVSLTSGTASGRVCVFVSEADNTFNGTDASGIYVWGAQLEAGSFATSYIPTGASTVTRSADVASVATSAFPYGVASGSFVVSGVRFGGAGYGPLVVPRNTATGINDRNPDMSLGAGAGGAAGSARVDVVSGGSVIAPLGNTSGSFVNGTIYKVGYAYATSDYASVVNGGAANIQASGGAPPSGINQVDIGQRNSSAFLNGWIRQITYLPRRLSNSELQARTV